MISRVRIILKRTVVGDWRFDNLSGSHLGVKWIVFASWWRYKSVSLKVIGQFSRDGIGWKTRVKFVSSHWPVSICLLLVKLSRSVWVSSIVSQISQSLARKIWLLREFTKAQLLWTVMQDGNNCKLWFMFVNRKMTEWLAILITPSKQSTGPSERSSGTLGKLPRLLRIFVASSLPWFCSVLQGKALLDHLTTTWR